MDKIIEKANELKSTLYELEEFKEYFRLKKLVEESSEIKSLELHLKSLDPNSREYHHLLKEYESYPLIVNFNKAKEEVASILNLVKDIIEK